MGCKKNLLVDLIRDPILILSHNFVIVLNQGNRLLLQSIHETVHLLVGQILHFYDFEDELHLLLVFPPLRLVIESRASVLCRKNCFAL